MSSNQTRSKQTKSTKSKSKIKTNKIRKQQQSPPKQTKKKITQNKTKKKQDKAWILFCVGQLHQGLALSWSTVDILSVGPLENIDVPSPSRYELEKPSWLGVGLHIHCCSHL